MNSRIWEFKLNHGWTARFIPKGEFRMEAEYWSLVLTTPDGKEITFFQYTKAVVNDFTGALAKQSFELSDNGEHIFFKFLREEWVLDFKNQTIAPYRWTILVRHEDRTLSVFEQPAFKNAQHYVHLKSEILYITFPFLSFDDMSKVMELYKEKRVSQIRDLYFNTGSRIEF